MIIVTLQAQSVSALIYCLQNTRYGGRKLDSQVMTRRVNWLNSIRDWQQDFLGSLDAHEFVECVTDELFGKGVLVFTPFGEVMRLPKASQSLLGAHLHDHTTNLHRCVLHLPLLPWHAV